MQVKPMIKAFLYFIAFFLSALSELALAGSFHSVKYCYMPCQSTLSGRLQIKNVVLNDPELHFTTYVLVLDKKISVPENGQYKSFSGEDHIQLEFINNKKKLSRGACITVVGKLTGPVTASDVYDLVMQVDTYSVCKAKSEQKGTEGTKS